MKFLSILLIAGSALAAAVPIQEMARDAESTQAATYKDQGKCVGSSCLINGRNEFCDYGSCSGHSGAACGTGFENSGVQCPR
ncbi:hypothetical protein ASPWEDRAFT_186668 [Aspergillus wentii DTO 134E9]|uniref:Chitin-binding type-1 domain-containing protein n=1 Tax=Aspergillus wentii DTO 134E9 TaxID=1073089 RepID=A0A1L9RCA1_ASPWE|nr:uncharacterized protein ASPWEDRAFT_186668 [Aspergillus wentii DTO 134E9]KAI9935058.1 hypothetical protein MW887_000679 [Aspergillus wentii]OJJ32497.1 hypothetical protein ASPWEDRAFT_186668 [Aspergillus wentii DTO 134E9]